MGQIVAQDFGLIMHIFSHLILKIFYYWLKKASEGVDIGGGGIGNLLE